MLSAGKCVGSFLVSSFQLPNQDLHILAAPSLGQGASVLHVLVVWVRVWSSWSQHSLALRTAVLSLLSVITHQQPILAPLNSKLSLLSPSLTNLQACLGWEPCYRCLWEKWSKVKLGHGRIFLLVFASVPFSCNWEFNLFLGSYVLKLQLRFKFYFQVWKSRGQAEFLLVSGSRYKNKYHTLPKQDPITTSQTMCILSALLLLLSHLKWFKYLPLYPF